MRAIAEMGEIRVDLELTNAVDESLVRRGMLAPNQVRSVLVPALVDTGAVKSCIPAELAKELGAGESDEGHVVLADGSRHEVKITDALRFTLVGRTTIDTAWVLGDEVLIGQTVLETTDLLADCQGQRLIPNPEHPDGPVLRAKLAIKNC